MTSYAIFRAKVRPLVNIVQTLGSFGIFAGNTLAGVPRSADPEIDEVDWYYRTYWQSFTESGSNPAEERFDHDIRTSRKIRGEDRTMILVVKNHSVSAASVQFGITWRLLLQRS